MLADGMGGISWEGLPYALALHEVDDVEALLRRLTVIKSYRPPKSEST